MNRLAAVALRCVATACVQAVCANFAHAQPTPVVPAPLAISGMVAHPGPVGTGALAGLKQVTYSGSFDSMSGKQSHRWTGPLLLDVLNQASITDEPGQRTHMRHVILARGSDGYAAALALGEIDPKGEGKQVIVALTQDGTPLRAPRLVVPGDASFTRAVHDLVSVELR